jgi:hypothetical protein
MKKTLVNIMNHTHKIMNTRVGSIVRKSSVTKHYNKVKEDTINFHSL